MNSFLPAHFKRLSTDFLHAIWLIEHVESLPDSSRKFKIFDEIPNLKWLVKVLWVIADKALSISTGDDPKIQRALQEKNDFFDNLKTDEPPHDVPGWLEALAKIAHKDIQFALGYMYDKKVYVQGNSEKAFFWYEMAERQDSVDAQYFLGTMFDLRGDYHTAIDYFIKVAKQNDPQAAEFLKKFMENEDLDPMLYAYGLQLSPGRSKILQEMRVQGPYKELKQFVERTKNQKAPYDQLALGKLLVIGVGIEQDTNEGFSLIREAAAQGNLSALEYLTDFATKNDRKESQYKYIAGFLPENVDMSAAAQYVLGRLYAGGLGVSQNDVIGFRCIGKAVAQNHGEALTYLVGCAKTKENPEAQYRLGKLYEGGLGVQQDHTTALKWISKAAAKGHQRAFVYLKDYAIFIGDPEANYRFGKLYHDGTGVKPDPIRALKHLRIAGIRGHRKAQNIINKTLSYALKEWSQQAEQDQQTPPENNWMDVEFINTGSTHAF